MAWFFLTYLFLLRYHGALFDLDTCVMFTLADHKQEVRDLRWRSKTVEKEEHWKEMKSIIRKEGFGGKWIETKSAGGKVERQEKEEESIRKISKDADN